MKKTQENLIRTNLLSLYNQLFLLDVPNLILSSYQLSSVKRQQLILTLENVQWDFNYLIIFLFLFNITYPLWYSFFFMCYIKEKNQVHLIFFIDLVFRISNFIPTTEQQIMENYNLLFHWLNFNNIKIFYYDINCISKNPYITQLGPIKQELIENKFNTIQPITYHSELASIFFNLINKNILLNQYCLIDNLGQNYNLLIWNENLQFLISNENQDISYNVIPQFFMYFINSKIIDYDIYLHKIYQDQVLARSYNMLVLLWKNTLSYKYQLKQLEDKDISYNSWFINFNKVIIYVPFYQLFDTAYRLGLYCVKLKVFYGKLPLLRVSNIIKELFLNKFKQMDNLHFVIFFQTIEDLQNNCLTFYIIKDLNSNSTVILNCFENYFGLSYEEVDIDDNDLFNLTSIYYNRFLGGNYSKNGTIFYLFKYIYSIVLFDIEIVEAYYKTAMDQTDWSFDGDFDDKIFLITRFFNAGLDKIQI